MEVAIFLSLGNKRMLVGHSWCLFPSKLKRSPSLDHKKLQDDGLMAMYGEKLTIVFLGKEVLCVLKA